MVAQTMMRMRFGASLGVHDRRLVQRSNSFAFAELLINTWQRAQTCEHFPALLLRLRTPYDLGNRIHNVALPSVPGLPQLRFKQNGLALRTKAPFYGRKTQQRRSLH